MFHVEHRGLTLGKSGVVACTLPNVSRGTLTQLPQTCFCRSAWRPCCLFHVEQFHPGRSNNALGTSLRKNASVPRGTFSAETGSAVPQRLRFRVSWFPRG